MQKANAFFGLCASLQNLEFYPCERVDDTIQYPRFWISYAQDSTQSFMYLRKVEL